MRLRRPLPAVQGDTLHIVGVGDNRIGKVLTIEHNGVPGPSAADVTQHLVANGIAAEQLDRPLNNRTYGAAMLEETMSLEPDLLIKGAFTHSRLHQMIFGGVTQHILHNAEIPVLMAH